MEYNREDAVAYARKYALSRNPNFYNFDTIGGDCSNFISQCLLAGSKKMNYLPLFGWYYRSLSDRTPSWSGVQQLYDFLTTNLSRGPTAIEVNEDEVMLGDLVQLKFENLDRFSHSLIITKKSGNRLFVSTHTRDALDMPLDFYIYDDIRFLHITGVND